MYSSKNSQFTPIYLAKKIHILKQLLHLSSIHKFIFCVLALCVFSGCSKADSSSTFSEDATSVITETIVPTATPTLEPSPTIKPSASALSDEEITIQSAQAILETQIDTAKYTLSLLTEELKIDSSDYIAFIANENSIPLEPILLVNKSDGAISYLSSDGKCMAFNHFPIIKNQYQELSECDWNGTFVCNDQDSYITRTLQIVQNDSFSFNFFLHISNSITTYTLAGIGHIQEDCAVFTDEYEHELLFCMDNGTINVCDADEYFFSSNISLSGNYIFEDKEIKDDYSISTKKATSLLDTLTMSQTKLPAPLSEYTLKAQDSKTIVKDRICYAIDAYAQLEKEQVLMTTFYVSLDGSVVFSYDNISDEPYSIISLP